MKHEPPRRHVYVRRWRLNHSRGRTFSVWGTHCQELPENAIRLELYDLVGVYKSHPGINNSTEFGHSAESPDRSGIAVPPENSGGCGPRTSSVAQNPRAPPHRVSHRPLAKLPQTYPIRTISSAESERPGESEMLQSDSSAQTASTHHLWHAASAIPAELRAGASKFNLELTASGSHLLQRSVPGLPFASLKLLRSAQPFEPGLRIHPLVTMKPQNFIRRDDPDFSLSVR